MTDDSTMLPCPNCGAELAGVDWLPRGEWKTVPVDSPISQGVLTFSGEEVERRMPTVKCPECGERVII